jgi:hypothetical protein
MGGTSPRCSLTDPPIPGPNRPDSFPKEHIQERAQTKTQNLDFGARHITVPSSRPRIAARKPLRPRPSLLLAPALAPAPAPTPAHAHAHAHAHSRPRPRLWLAPAPARLLRHASPQVETSPPPPPSSPEKGAPLPETTSPESRRLLPSPGAPFIRVGGAS